MCIRDSDGILYSVRATISDSVGPTESHIVPIRKIKTTFFSFGLYSYQGIRYVRLLYLRLSSNGGHESQMINTAVSQKVVPCIDTWVGPKPITLFSYSTTGGAYVISNQNPRCTQKPIYSPIFTHHIRS